MYTNFDPGGKAFAVELFGNEGVRLFEFVQAAPGFEAVFMSVDFAELYPATALPNPDLAGLRRYLGTLSYGVAGGGPGNKR